tara:strand:- start:343 stop:1707 length:1365 start_codon:yes stop_codon:yes gene_type:complete
MSFKNPSNNSKTSFIAKVYNDQITLYTLDGSKSGRIYYRFISSIDGQGYVRRSSKTSDIALASKRAIDAFNEDTARAALGMKSSKITISKIFKRFDSELSPSTAHLRARYFRRWLLPYFKDDDLFRIDENDIIALIKYRIENTNDHNAVIQNTIVKLTPSTIVKELGFLSTYLRRAFQKRLILYQVKFPSESKISTLIGGFHPPANQRAGRLSDEQEKAFTRFLKEYRRNYNLKSGRIYDRFIDSYPRKRYNWARMYMLIHLVKSGGLRPQEAMRLRFSDVHLWSNPSDDDEIKYTLIDVRPEVSKVKKYRDVILKDGRRFYDRLQELWIPEWTQHFRRPPNEDDLLFPRGTGTGQELSKNYPIQFRRNLKTLSEFMEIDLTHRDYGTHKRNITLYSFRSSYITEMLRDTSIDIYTLSKAIGSSPNMISLYYDVNQQLHHRRVLTSHYAKYLKR